MHSVMEMRLERNHVGGAALEHLMSDASLISSERCFLAESAGIEH